MLVAVNRYLLDNRRPEAGERFAALAELFDPWTFGHLDDLGLVKGGGVGRWAPAAYRCRAGWQSAWGRAGGFWPPTSTCRGSSPRQALHSRFAAMT